MKVDLFIRSADAFDESEFSRRVRLEIQKTTSSANCAGSKWATALGVEALLERALASKLTA